MIEFLKRLFGLNAGTSQRKRAGFRQLDVDEEAVKMRLEHHGRKDGAREVPSSGAQRFGTVESQIIEMGENMLQENVEHYEQEYQSYIARLAALTPEGMLQNARLQSQGQLSEIAALPQAFGTPLAELRGKAADTQKELKLFRHDNGLGDRTAHYPSSKILHVGLMLALLVAESFLNATFLAEGNDLGLLGGWTEAIVISLVNAIAIGCAISWGVRWLTCYKTVTKLWGALVLTTFVSGAIAFNLFVAHYRNALGGETPELAGSYAWDMMFSQPWDLGDFKSVMLLMFGLLVVGLAAIDWLFMDDIYPGYGRITRKHIEARGEHAEFQHWLVHEELKRLRDQANDIISSHLSSAAGAATEHARILGRISNLNGLLQGSLDNIQSGVNRLLQIYREANIAGRDSESPSYFENSWRYERQVPVHPVPETRELPPIESFMAVLEPLQQDLDRTYKKTLRILNEMNE